jgi:hypothetical protein
MPSRPLANLLEAPDSTIGDRHAKTKPPQAMFLELDTDVLEKMLSSIRNGKQAQVEFGRNQVCSPTIVMIAH